MLASIALFAMLMVENVDAEQAVNQKKTEPREITIYIIGQHKAMAAALLEAVDEGSTITGIDDFDSLSAIYGLMGIYRKGRRSSGFYRYHFRLTFLSVADVATIAGAYWNLSYVKSVEPEPVGLVESRGLMSTGKRVALKLITGTVGGLMGAMIVAEALPCFWKDYQGDRPIFCDSLGPALLYGYPAGIAIGVSQVAVKTVDPRVRSEMSLIKSLGVSLGGSAVGLIGGILLTHVNTDMFWPSFFIGPIVGATWASERWCPPPAARHISVGLVPDPKGGLSAVATLRF